MAFVSLYAEKVALGVLTNRRGMNPFPSAVEPSLDQWWAAR